MKNVLIIGGGVSGVTTAIGLASEKVKVTLMEGNDKLLKKLLITGNGRCNFYNEDQSSIIIILLIKNFYINF